MTWWHCAAIVAWWISGSAGFVWAWTRRYDLTTRHLFGVLISGFWGPFGWPYGYFMFVREPWDRPLIRRREG